MRNHKLLLGSTALVGAGFLLAGAPPAGAAGMQVKFSGNTEFEVLGATEDTLNETRNRNYSFFMDNQVDIEATATTDSGITYGSYLEIEVGIGDGAAQNANVTVDEVNLFFSGNFGRVELGQQDGAEDVMFVGGEDAQSGTGGVDGDTANLATVINVRNTDDATKATYFTPRMAGFQLGASFTPDTTDNQGTKNNSGVENSIGVGGNWVGAFGDIDLTLSAVGIVGKGETIDDTNGSVGDVRDYSVGGLLGFGELSFGATWGQLTKDDEARFINLGLEYSFGSASASLGYSRNWIDDQDNLNVFVVSADYGLMPGVTLEGDVSWNTDDPQKEVDRAGNSVDSGDTLSGVASIQLDY